MKKAINFLAFQAGWFAAVLGAAHGMPWLGIGTVILVIALNLFAITDDRGRDLRLIAAAGFMGLMFDTAMTAMNAFKPVPYVLPPPFSPLWMVMLWMNQATTVNSCLGWLRGRYVLSGVFGALGGPLAYLGGAKLGAAEVPTTAGLCILAAGWALAFPALM